MSLGIVDAFIVLFLVMGALIGFKSGVIKELTKFLGFFAVIVISFLLKDTLMVLFYENLPFFNFFGIIRGIDAMNILFYQLLSFLIIFAAFMFVLKVLLVVTGLVEWLLKMTIFLSLPSKILGAVVGMIEYYVYIFLVLYILTMPVFNLSYVSESRFANQVLEDTPFLSGLIDDTVEVYSDVWQILRNKEGNTSKEVNTLVLATLLDHDLIEIDSAKKLVEANKIIILDKSLLDQYDDEVSFFEKIGGCAFIGGCGNERVENSFSVYSVGEKTRIGENLSVEVMSISDAACVARANRNCKENAKIKVGVSIQTLNGVQHYELITNRSHRLIEKTNTYVYADIEDGSLVLKFYKK